MFSGADAAEQLAMEHIRCGVEQPRSASSGDIRSHIWRSSRHSIHNIEMKSYLSKIDTKTLGNRYDVTPLFADAECFSQLVKDLATPFQNTKLDFVACIDALGFILGTALAYHLGIAIIPIRKGGKLPVKTDGEEFSDYSGETKRLEIRKSIISPKAHILLVDEWIETGAQIQAAVNLIEAQGGIIAGIASIAIDINDKTAKILNNYNVHTVWTETEQVH